MSQIEHTILSNLVYNEEFGRKVLPFIDESYFADDSQKLAFRLIYKYIDEYNTFPTTEALQIELKQKENISPHTYEDTQQLLGSLTSIEGTSLEWLLDKTEKFCQERALFNALRESIAIIDNKNSKHSKGQIPKLLQDALAVSFNTEIGHDYLDDADKRFDYYHTKVARIPFHLDYLNKVTKGGLPKKTLSVFIAGVNVGKTMMMCDCAGNNLRDGYNVLYISMEMSQEEISKRIDANLLDITLDDLETVPKETFDKRIDRVRNTTKGKLIVREYPTSQAHVGHFRHLLNELKLKKNFLPDIIYIDYINICASSRIKRGQANSYEYIKAISEELRGLAVEFELPIVTATQLNRSGFKSSDVDMDDTAESFGLPATADLMLALISTEQHEEMNQIRCKQLKNRLGSKQSFTSFMIGIDRAKARFYDVEQESPDEIIPAGQGVFDNTRFGNEENERNKPRKFDFSDFR